MNAKRREFHKDEVERRPRKRVPQLGQSGRWVAIASVIVLVTAGVCYGVWRQVRSHVLAGRQYQVDAREILITPLPPWIRTDLPDEVIREASLTGPLSLLEPRLTPRVAGAFAAHPWVERVRRVSKRFPSGLEVELQYRKPVAVVEVTDGALPVDVRGVVLPTSDFRPGEADLFPRIGGIHTSPAGLVGEPWGDAGVVGGAEIAAALADAWQSLDLFRIAPAGRRPGGRGGVEYTYAIFTRGGTRIDWGLAPGTTVSAELPATDKVAQLKRFAAQHGSLDGEKPHQLYFNAVGQLEAVVRQPVAPLPRRD